MTDGGRQHVTLSKRDRRAAVRMVQDNIEALAESEPRSLLALKNDIELITLNQLIERYQEMLGKGLTESKWQSFFLENPFILSLAFAVPAMLVQGQAYAGGKRLNGSGGKFSDFLYASASTGNLGLIEIKKPQTELLGKSPYRGDDVFGPSTELGGAIAQILDQRFKLQSELPVIKNSMNRYDLHSYAVRCIVVAGMTPQEHQQRKSFELVRNAFAEIVIVTFDELLARLTEIKNALQPYSYLRHGAVLKPTDSWPFRSWDQWLQCSTNPSADRHVDFNNKIESNAYIQAQPGQLPELSQHEAAVPEGYQHCHRRKWIWQNQSLSRNQIAA